MADALELMAILLECKGLAKEEDRQELEQQLDEKLKRYGFNDVEQVKERMKLPVQRIIQARKLADQQLVQLAQELL